MRSKLSCVVVSLLLISANSWATVYYVDSRVQGGDGLSWPGAKKTVMAAIASAHAGDEIWVAQGTYAEAIGLFSGLSLYGGFSGTETALSQRDVAGRETVIDGSTAAAGGPALHVVTLSNVSNVRLDGFTITGGEADGEGGSVARGGGLYATNAANSVVIANCRFVRNAAPHFVGQGGGAYVVTSAIRFENCAFEANSAGELGGAWSCYGGTPTLQGCVFRGNVASSGGAAYLDMNSTVTFNGCDFEGNIATGMFGGAVEVRDSIAQFAESTFLGNTGSEGGAIMGFNATSMQFQRCTFVGNSAGNYGGGLAAYGSNVLMSECTLAGNIAGPRGGGGVEAHQGSLMHLSNCVLVGNNATGSGGAVMVEEQSCRLDNCTIASNTSVPTGGGVYIGPSGALAATNTLITDDANGAIALASSATLTSLDHCFLSNNPQADILWDGHTTPLTGAALIEAFLPQAEGTVDGFAGFAPGVTGALTVASTYDAVQNRTVLTDATKTFADGVLRGSILSIAGAANTYSYVTDNTANTVTVFGNLSGPAVAGATYRFLNIHLGGGSACIDHGTSAGAPATDIDGETRGYDVSGVGEGGLGAFYDIGADESIDPDSDGDFLSDGLEEFLGTNPDVKDTDGDGVDDMGEYMIIGTDPLRQDTDGDWFTDGEEVYGSSDPKSPSSIPYPVGDVDHSKQVDATDVQSVINGALGKHTDYRTDIDISGRTDARDVQLVINAVLNPVPM